MFFRSVLRRCVRPPITEIGLGDLNDVPCVNGAYIMAVIGSDPPLTNVSIIDVRALHEARAWGLIPTAKILPIHEIVEGLQMVDADFMTTFGFTRPNFDTEIIFYCQFGPRALMAAQIAQHLGFKSVRYYEYGFQEWARQYYKIIRRWDLVDKEKPYRALREDLFDEALQLERDVAPELNYLVAKEMDPLIEATMHNEPLAIPAERMPGLQKALKESQITLQVLDK